MSTDAQERPPRVEAFIIHLARAEARGAQARKLAAGLPVRAEIMSAVDGRDLTEAQLAMHYRRSLHKPHYPFRLSNGEVACFLSHRAAWSAIVDRGLDAGLIVEDDVELGPGFASVLSVVSHCMGARDYVRFPRWERGEAGQAVSQAGPISVIEPFLPALGMQVQLVGQEAARLLLAATQTFDRPVDSIVQMQWLHGARVLSARPIAIREIDRELGGTVLQKKQRSVLEKLNHELRRPLMRAAVARRNRRWRAGQKGR